MEIIELTGLTLFTVALLHKWNVIQWMIQSGVTILEKWGNCPFCLSFWISVLLSPLVLPEFTPQNLLTIPSAGAFSYFLVSLLYD
jgi:hypothetical protein